MEVFDQSWLNYSNFFLGFCNFFSVSRNFNFPGRIGPSSPLCLPWKMGQNTPKTPSGHPTSCINALRALFRRFFKVRCFCGVLRRFLRFQTDSANSKFSGVSKMWARKQRRNGIRGLFLLHSRPNHAWITPGLAICWKKTWETWVSLKRRKKEKVMRGGNRMGS